QKIQESLIVLLRHSKQIEERAIVPLRRGKSPRHQTPHVVSCDIPHQKHRIDVIPEGILTANEGIVELVGHPHPFLGSWKILRTRGLIAAQCPSVCCHLSGPALAHRKVPSSCAFRRIKRNPE